MAETDFDAKLSSLNRKITQNKAKHVLVENKLNKLKTFDSGYFIGKSHFEEDGVQNYCGTKARLEFRGSCLKQGKSIFNH